MTTAAMEAAPRVELPIIGLRAAAYRIPTDRPEADGTLSWNATTLVVVRVETGGGATGLGYTYTDASAVGLVRGILADALRGQDAVDPARARRAMLGAARNIGQSGLAASATSAVDVALWDLKARALHASLATLLGTAHDAIPGYGSGGFTSYPDDVLRDQLRGWVQDDRFRRVKMKVGSDPDDDPRRVAVARDAIGDDAELFVDANGAYEHRQAISLARSFAMSGVRWYEEPVPQADVDGLRFVRDHAPGEMQVAAGEYAYGPRDFLGLLRTGAVDAIQADATRCGGVSGFLQAASMAEAFGIPLSTHTAPALHTTLACAAPAAVHLEWFHDHVRIEQMAFDGAPHPVGGMLAPDRARPGLGLELREADMRPFLVEDWA